MVNFVGTSGNDIFTGGSTSDTAYGYGGDDSLSGAGGNDLIAGNAGADTIDGGAGDDILYSGDPNPGFGYPYSFSVGYPPILDTGSEVDTLTGGTGDDHLFAGYGDNVDGGANGVFGDTLYISFIGASHGVTADFRQATQVIGGGTITGIENVGWVQGSNYADDINVGGGTPYSPFTIVYGMGGDDHLVAGYLTGALFGGDGNDVVDGRPGGYINIVDGGSGNDTLYTNSNSPVVAYGGDGDDTIYAAGETHGGAGDDVIVLQASEFGGRVFGDDGNDQVQASTTPCFMSGGNGADILNGNSGADTLISGSVDPSTNLIQDDMGLEHDVLAGGGDADTFYAGYGDDVDGGGGSDTLHLSLGGLGHGITFDTAAVGPGQTLSLGGGTIHSVETLDSLRGTEFNDVLNLATQATRLTVDAGAGDDVITSHNSSVTVHGGSGDDRFVSGPAGDIFDGGDGSDTVDYGAYASAVTVNLVTGLGAGGDQLSNVENVIGTAFADSLTGDGGANVLDGGAGADTLDGGAGSDTASYADAGSAVTVSLGASGAQNTGGGGVDTLTSIENLTGSGFNDVLTGDSGANVLDGGGDDDLMDGGAGVDTASYASAGAGVIVNLAVAGPQNTLGSGTDTLISIENLTGSPFDDFLMAGAAGSVLVGGGGVDFLIGGNGDDVFDGRGGTDTASYTLAATGVSVDMGFVGGQATGAGTDTLIGIHTVAGSSFADQFTAAATGSAMVGSGGNDLLIGGEGNDILAGGLGVDTASYAGASSGVHVSLLTTAAQNTIGAGTDTLTSIEKIFGSAFADVLTANSTGPTLNGGNGGDDLIGGPGNDLLNGGGASDFADYALATAGVTVSLAITTFQNTLGAGSDELVGIEKLSGSAFNDTLTGDANANVIYGVGGADSIIGGGGQDILSGGAGGDKFVFTAVSDSTIAAPDTILDFQSGDHIDLHQIDADGGTAGDQAFHVGATPGHTGDIVVGAFVGGHTVVSLYVNGDSIPDAAIWLNGDHHGLTATDFVL